MTLDDALLAFYRLTERNEGLPPTLREFADECGLGGTSVAAHWFEMLTFQGLTYTPASLINEHRGARTLQLSKAGRQRAYLLTEAELRIA